VERKRLDLLSWLLRVIAWDGLLPVAVVLTPTIIELLFPHNRGLIEPAFLWLPIAAFGTRYVVGKRHIMSNACTPTLKHMQFLAFVLGICALFFIETWLILLRLMPWAVVFEGGDKTVMGILVMIYLTAMVIAMYPGLSKREGT
jgi:hypothetical protein